jgi:DNA primase
MNIKTQFDLFLGKIRPHILEYLQSKGVNTNQPIRCLNPDHEDHHPSMLCANAEQNDWRLFCYSCGIRFDLFDVYAIFEGTPRKGKNWIKKTVLPLAQLFNVPPPIIELSANDQFRYDLYKTFEDVASFIQHDMDRMELFPSDYIREKNWEKKTLEDLDIGTLSYEELSSKIGENDRRRFGLNRPDLFNKDNVIFTIRDQFGRPVRFFGRRPDNNPKFLSTKTSNLVVDIWRGMGHLYLSNLCSKTNSTAIVVEGHPDAVTLYQEGVENTIALCGCRAFAEAHVDSLALNGISNVVLAYDGDAKGQEASEALLRKDFVKYSGINFEVAVLPEEHDPDSYVREEGADKFKYLLEQKLTAFEYLLSKEDPDQTAEEICEKLIPYIATARSDIRREIMARALVAFTNERVSIGAVLADVMRVDDSVLSAIMEKQKVIVKASIRQAQNHVPQAKEIFRQAIDKLDAVEKEHGNNSAKANCLSRLQSCKTIEEGLATGGYQLLPESLGQFTDLLEGGFWFHSKVIVVGGVKNAGKSTFIDNFIWEAISNQDNNAIAFLLTIDDPAEARFRRMGCCAVRDFSFTQNMITTPNYYANELGVPDVYTRRELAYSRLTEMIASGRLIVEDQRDGSTLAYAEQRIAQIRRENPEANIIFGLDNFHDCTDWVSPEIKDRVGFKIKYGKRICEIHKALGLFSAEYRKLADQSKPGSDDDLADCLVEDSPIFDYKTMTLITIADMYPGAIVTTIDTETFEPVLKQIVRKFDKGFHQCYKVTLANGYSIEGTCNHPLLRQDNKWTKIKDLVIGDKIFVTDQINWREIISIKPTDIKHVYDIEVEGNHNFVSNGILCHNSRGMSYAPHLTIHLYSDLDYKGDNKAVLIHKNNGIIMPRLSIGIGKNKITSRKGKNLFGLGTSPKGRKREKSRN